MCIKNKTRLPIRCKYSCANPELCRLNWAHCPACSLSSRYCSCFLPQHRSRERGRSELGMGFPRLGQGQGWSAATLPLSSQAPAPSLYLRSQNHIHGALGVSGTDPLPATHRVRWTGNTQKWCIDISPMVIMSPYWDKKKCCKLVFSVWT